MPTVCRHLETAGRRTRAELSPDDRWRAGVRGQGRIARRGCRRVALPDRRVAACGGMRPVADRAACEDDHSRERHLVHHRRARAGLSSADAVVPVGANTAERIKKLQGKRWARMRWKPGRGLRATCADGVGFPGRRAPALMPWHLSNGLLSSASLMSHLPSQISGWNTSSTTTKAGRLCRRRARWPAWGNGSLWPEGRVL